MSILGIWWEAAKKLVGARTIYEAIALLAVLLFYEGIPGIAWVGNKVPVVGAYFYLIEGRVPRSYYQGTADERAKWEAERRRWEEAKRIEIGEVSKGYTQQIAKLRSNSTQLQEVLEATQKDLDDEKKAQDPAGTGRLYCPPAVPSRLRNYLNSIR